MDNLEYSEDLYAQWRVDPASVAPAWAEYFAAAEAGPPRAEAPVAADSARHEGQDRVDSLLWAYRDVGYLYAKLNPLGDYGPEHDYLPRGGNGDYERLTPEEFHIPAAALDRSFTAGRAIKPSPAPLRVLLDAFRQTYCGSIGVEFLHIQHKRIRRWLIDAMESTRNQPNLSDAQRRTILHDLLRTEELEHFLDTFFLGQKRFSLEGSEALIPALHYLVDHAAAAGLEDVVIGTAHRGRLSILTQVLGMSAEELFSCFEENFVRGMFGGSGDVKYHIGYDTDHVHEDGYRVHVNLVSNPSHLESVDPVAEGKARALQDRKGDERRTRVLPVLIHGDAAFSGQGIVPETLNLARLPAYATGGTIHFIINNQIGFTTPSRSARSTVFPTDVAKMLPIPIFHVNGDDPEAIVHVTDLALRFRQEFAMDAIVDIFCFRRHGHNEGDEPSFTHPRMYTLIAAHPGVGALYGERCSALGLADKEDQARVREQYRGVLKTALDHARTTPAPQPLGSQGPEWDAFATAYSDAPVATAVPEERVRPIAAHLTAVPGGFHIHRKLLQIVRAKRETLAQKHVLDWAFAEALAFGSLLLDGVPVRMSGQDSVRGTFAQRHLTWWDVESPMPASHTPLNSLPGAKARLMAFDSPLSEFSVLGFEYGYSMANPHGLTIWEAQFGDFANGAQVIIDNYIVCAESKWRRKSGLVLLLPHGNEGQGPDHSSAHPERFLQLCADDNIQVCNPTTPAQYFHLLRRQAFCTYRKPLVVMAPKSLLRHPAAVSTLGELSSGTFAPVLCEPSPIEAPRRVILCSGKIYYDLQEQRDKLGRAGVALVRLEQLYPFPARQLAEAMARYATAPDIVWVQEEHRNYGAWSFITARLAAAGIATERLRYVGRPESPSTATGQHKEHHAQQVRLVEEALA